MGVERVKLFRKLRFDIDTDGPVSLFVRTDLPGHDITNRYQLPDGADEAVNTEATTTGRRTFTVRLPGETRGHYIQLRIEGDYIVRIYRAQVHAKPLDSSARTPWQWYDIPVEQTPDLWSSFKLPIEPTADDWGSFTLPIEPTPDEWRSFELPIEPTSDGWDKFNLPIRPTEEQGEWVTLPMDD